METIRDAGPAPSPSTRTLPTLQKAVYALGDHTVNIGFAALAFHYLFFLTEVVGMRPSLAGLVLWVGRLADAFTDPLMGRISDNTNWRLGRRRPYFLLGALPYGAAYALMWLDVPFQSQTALFVYYSLAYLGFSLTVTVLSVPYLALIPEMAFDYQERTSLNSFRGAGAMAGALVVAVGLRPLADLLGGGSRGFAGAGLVYGIWCALPWIAVYAASFEREGFRRPKHAPFFRAVRELFHHHAYRAVAMLYLFSRMAVDLAMAMLIFYFEYWLRRPGDFEISMGLLLVFVLVSLPAWVKVSHRTDKRSLFLAACVMWMVLQIAFLAANPSWPRLLVFAMAAFAGVAYAAIEMMPWSMLGDVVDEDEVESGERREGLYAGSFMLLRKISGPTGVLLAGVVLEAADFRGEGAAQPESAVQAIRALTAVAPLAFVALGAWAARDYPLSRAAHARILHALATRRGGSLAARPDS